MWILTLRSPISGPIEYVLKRGKNTLGRKSDNDVVIADESASRLHAEIDCSDRIVIRDLGSTNGTYVNHERLTTPLVLKSGDQIRIGQHIATIVLGEDNVSSAQEVALSGTQPLTRDLLLESVEQNSILLYEISSRLSTILDLDQALKEVSQIMQVMMGADKFELILAEDFDHLDELGFPTSMAREALEKRSVIVFPYRPTGEQRSASESTQLLRIRSLICSPVVIGEEVVALVYAYRTNPQARLFDERDVQLAVALGHQVALTIQRTRLMEQVHVFEHWAITDSVTGLLNRRQVLVVAEKEVHRASHFHHPLSVVMLDVDSFKLINDTHGHPAGDQVLQTITRRWKGQLRDIDMLGRYGGDEFLLVLVETDLDNAAEAAERLCRCIADRPIDTDHGSLDITVSAGVAALSEKNATLATIIDRADEALYVAKRNGKNRVEISS